MTFEEIISLKNLKLPENDKKKKKITLHCVYIFTWCLWDIYIYVSEYIYLYICAHYNIISITCEYDVGYRTNGLILISLCNGMWWTGGQYVSPNGRFD